MNKIILALTVNGIIVGMLLKKYILVLILSIFGLSVLANPKLASKQQIGMFINSKTCVVLESGINPYNLFIQDAVNKYWKSTEFEFIDQQEFEKRRFDSKYSFLVLMKNIFDKDPGGVSYNFISLVLGDTSKNITNMPELCCIPISYTNDNTNNFGYVIPSIVKFMQKHVKTLETKRFLISLRGLKYYNGSPCFQYTLLLMDEKMMAADVNSIEKIKSVYPYFVILSNSTKIEADLATNPSNTMFNFHVGPTQNTGTGKCFEMIFDTEGNLYYYNSRKITNDNENGFNLKDFKNIKRANLFGL
ncbi:MAG: hypothetical protein HOO91_15545 [Bacteroidales bacterium]|nr:hypothetical protein [Bacteroidales bacterium]